MPLYSTEAQTNARGKQGNVADTTSATKGEVCTTTTRTSSWCYLFVHHRKVNMVSDVLHKGQYRVFVHTSIVYTHDGKHIRKTEKPTISGLMFVQGDGNEIQAILKETFSDIYLIKDCSKGEIATIPDDIMQPFMNVSRAHPTRIRFMPHPIDYYSKGNPLVKITSGVLSGMQGYRIRISRDKCLITTLGGMTVAIGGIHKENFENVDGYVRMRREQAETPNLRPNDVFTPLQKEIDRCFFVPETQLDVMVMAVSIAPWITRMKAYMEQNNPSQAAEIALFILEEMGDRLKVMDSNAGTDKLCDMMTIGREADKALMSMMSNAAIRTNLKEMIKTAREALAIRYPFLPIEL